MKKYILLICFILISFSSCNTTEPPEIQPGRRDYTWTVDTIRIFSNEIHFNNKRWKSYINESGLDYGSYAGLAVKGNLVAATGVNNQQAVILIGKR